MGERSNMPMAIRLSRTGALLAGALVIGIAGADAAESLTRDELARFRPELCRSGSSLFQTLTGVLPFLVGSPAGSMASEQIALIDEDKASDRRKVWVLKLPAAFIVSRTCDAGRENWVGKRDDRRVYQRFQLALLLTRDNIIPYSRSTQGEREAGVEIKIDLHNRVRGVEVIRGAYVKDIAVVGNVGIDGPPRCRDTPGPIPGLVAFKRIDPNVFAPFDCESGFLNGVFAEKIGELNYEFIALCAANCRIHRDYDGWNVQYLYGHKYLAEWKAIHTRLRAFLDQYTLHRDAGD